MNSIKFFILLLFIFFNKINACSCTEQRLSLRKMVNSEYEVSKLIFVGEVIDIKDTNQNKHKSTMDIIVYTFKIKRLFKGTIQTEHIKVKSYRDSSSCGYVFKEGAIYLVYSDLAKITDKQKFQTDSCKRNQIYANVERKEIHLLNNRCKVQRTD